MQPSLWIIAQTPYHNRLEGLRGAFNDRPSNPTDTSGALILIGAAVALLVLWLILQRSNGSRGDRSRSNRTGKIYPRILKKFDLTLPDRLFLKMFAREANLTQPAIIFFDEQLFDRHSARWLDSMSMSFLRHRAQAAFDRVRMIAFPDSDGPATDEESLLQETDESQRNEE